MAETSNPSHKRTEGVLSWKEYFMSVAFLSAKRSKDPLTRVGACIVNEDLRIVGIGYNGMANGIKDDEMDWSKEGKRLYVCHAEMNAIVNKIQADVRGCTMYVSMFPCNECAKLLIQSGIKKVVFYSDKKHDKDYTAAARKLLKKAGVETEPYKNVTKVVIDFSEIDETA
ncbi:deoxycytidylate deaminase-like isoform X3 [Babylonia areolata]